MASPPSAPSSLRLQFLRYVSSSLGLGLGLAALHRASPSAGHGGGVDVNHIAAMTTSVPREVGDDAELRAAPRILHPVRENPGEIRAAPAVLALARRGRAPTPPGPPAEGDGGRGGHHN